jgi:hypothetical protein
MKNQPQKQELHTMPLGKKFSYYGKKYRMIVPSTVKVRAMIGSKKLAVLDLTTSKIRKLSYLTKVLRISE